MLVSEFYQGIPQLEDLGCSSAENLAHMKKVDEYYQSFPLLNIEGIHAHFLSSCEGIIYALRITPFGLQPYYYLKDGKWANFSLDWRWGTDNNPNLFTSLDEVKKRRLPH